MKKIIKSLLILTFLISCTPKKEEQPIPEVKKPEITNLIGGSISLKTTDSFKELTTQTVYLDGITPIEDGTVFRIVSDDLFVSENSIDWVKDILVLSENGFLKIYIKPNQTPGIYRINIYPVESDLFNFEKNLTAKFFIEVLPGIPNKIVSIVSERFEDNSPYNNIKDSNESWVIPANKDLTNYITVGPISDPYNNLINEGQIQLSVSQGQIVSSNPVQITDGYAYFSYKPLGEPGDLTVSANLIGIDSVNLIKNTSIKLVRQELSLLDSADFTNMSNGEIRIVELRLKNNGSLPATNLSINVTSPFELILEDPDSCKERGSLRSQEICKIKIKLTKNTTITQNGLIQIFSEPSEFVTSSVISSLIVSETQQRSMSLSQSIISFDQSLCGETTTKEIFLKNNSDISINNLVLTQPSYSVLGYDPFFKIVLPPADINPSSNIDDIINCGQNLPAGRKCRVYIEYKPLSSATTQPVLGIISGDNVQSVAITMNGSNIPGYPTNSFNISFLKSSDYSSTSSIYAQNGQNVVVKVGPFSDLCGNNLQNGQLISGSVSTGYLTNIVSTTNNGYAEFIWNATSSPESLGSQSFTATYGSFSNSKNINFQGINLSISGPNTFGQVIVENPSIKDQIYTITNTGNIRADGISLQFTTPLVLVDLGTCAAGISVNQSCSLTIGSRPTANNDYSSSITVNTTSYGINNASISNILTTGRFKPNIRFDLAKYLFNDGNATTNISKVLKVTNYGPSISKSTSFQIESPYSIISNTCPTDIQVNQSCNITVQVNRSQSLGSGAKTIKINNEVENETFSSILSYIDLQFGSQSYNKYKKYYCLGPFDVKVLGSDSIQRSIPQTLTVNLSSDSGNISYFSDSTCNNKILSTQVLANNSASNQFYLRSNISEITNALAESPSIPVTSREFSFDDISNDLFDIKPGLAIKNTSCILCHSNVKSNIITDFNFTTTQKEFKGIVSTGSGEMTNATEYRVGGSGTSYWSGIANGSMSFGTSYIEGKIYAKKTNIATTSLNSVKTMISANKPTYFDSNTPSSTISTIADYVNSIVLHRSNSYINSLFNFTNGSGTFSKDPYLNPRNASVREVNNITIGYPSVNKITSYLDSLNTYKYYKWDINSLDLLNFESQYSGNYFGNNPGLVMECDGDLFVDGPVFLKELQIKTTTGCRIYATGVVFIQAAAGLSERDGITFIDKISTSNIQITSSKGILLGLSQSIITSRKTMDNSSLGPLLTTMDSDVSKIKDNTNTNLLQDAASGGSRKVNFERILLNAPRVDSRYTGKFTGSIITEHSVWSGGAFNFYYDSVFNIVPIFPFMSQDTFLKVEDCVMNNIDYSIVKDSYYDYRSCN